MPYQEKGWFDTTNVDEFIPYKQTLSEESGQEEDEQNLNGLESFFKKRGISPKEVVHEGGYTYGLLNEDKFHDLLLEMGGKLEMSKIKNGFYFKAHVNGFVCQFRVDDKPMQLFIKNYGEEPCLREIVQ